MTMQGIAYHRIAAELLRDHETALPPNIFGDRPVDRHSNGTEVASIAFAAEEGERAHGRLLANLRQLDGQEGVVARLAACGPERLCLHVICPKCERLIGRWLAWTIPTAVRKILNARLGVRDRDWSSYCRTVTVTAARLRADDSWAPREIYAGIVERLHGALRGAGVTMAIGGVEFVPIRDAATFEELEFVVKLRAILFYGESQLTSPIPIKSAFGPVLSALKEAVGKTFAPQVRGRRTQTVMRGSRWAGDHDEIARLMKSDLKLTTIRWDGRKPNGSRKPVISRVRPLAPDELECLLALTSRSCLSP